MFVTDRNLGKIKSGKDRKLIIGTNFMADRLFWKTLLFFVCCQESLLKSPLVAQIVPDNSLNHENSFVTPNIFLEDTTADLIEGGAIRDNNLFHSFVEFNISPERSVYFNSPKGIDNILTRVTGNNPSRILGKLGVRGTGNLFLLNPHGIIFGDNSSLDLNGSFLATTADSYLFQNDFEYSASNLQSPPLLTINLPVGLKIGTNPGDIINHSRYQEDRTSDRIQGLSISPHKTLSLVGGDVFLAGGYLSTSPGEIVIGAVGAGNKIDLVPNTEGWNFNYEGVTNFADLKIFNQGGIDGGKTGGTAINLTGKNISLGYDLKSLQAIDRDLADFFTLEELPLLNQLPSDTVNIIAANSNNKITSQVSIEASETFSIINGGSINIGTAGKGHAGNLDITADSIVIYGKELQHSGFESNTTENSSGNAGMVTVNANQMSVQNGGGGVNTSGFGDGGKIELNIARDLKIQFGGFGSDTFSTEDRAGDGGKIEINAGNLEIVNGGAGVNTLGPGNGGKIELNIARDLKIQFGGLGANTFGRGDGGKITINANSLLLQSAGIGVNAGNIGLGGQIKITAKNISLEDALITSRSGIENTQDFDRQQLQARFGRQNGGNGGKIFIVADSLSLKNGGNITTTTIGVGNAGTIQLEADRLQLDGNSETSISSSTGGSGNGGNIEITSQEVVVGGKASITASANLQVDLTENLNRGNAGDINLRANTIQLQDLGKIAVDGGKEGGSGNIHLAANQIYLTDNSLISAQVELGNEGNIILTAKDLFLDDRSKITTNAIDNSTGGNIFLNLQDNLLAKENSQIVSNAVRGRGGNIQIETRGLFISSDKTIEASSTFGVDGSVRVDTINANSTSGLIQLPDKPIDPSFYLTAGCGLRNKYSFINIGRGGLPANPVKSISQQDLLPDLTEVKTDNYVRLSDDPQITFPESLSSSKKAIAEATTWRINHQGNIELVGGNFPDLARRDRKCQKGYR